MGDYLFSLVLTVHVLVGLGVIGLVLVQHGKGADMGAAFGSGASGSLFGASGSANFLSRTTAVLATVFFVCTLALAYFGFSIRTAEPGSGSVLDRGAVSAPAPAASAAAAAASGVAAGIPTGTPAAADALAAVPAAPAAPASGAAQIPTR